MKTVLLLAEFETSRYSPYLIGTKKSNYNMIALGLLVFLAANVAVLRHYATASGLIMINTVFLIEAFILILLVEYMSFTKSNDRDWWLLLPYSRMKLVLGKAVGYGKVVCHLFLYLTFVRLLHYAISVRWFGTAPASLPELLGLIGANAIMVIAGLPVLIGFGLLLIVFQTWWARIILFLLFIYTIVPVTVFVFLAGAAEFASAHLGAAQMVYYATITAAIGWPAAALLLWLAAKVGMKHLGSIRYKGGWSWLSALGGQEDSADLAGENRGGRRTPFRALVALERKRYRLLTNSRSGTLISVLLAAIIGTIAYNSSGEMWDYVSFFSFVVIFSYMGIVIFMINRQAEFQKTWALWWITFPHSRYTLALSRVTAYLSVMMPYWLVLAGSGVGGALVRQWIDPMPQEHWLMAGQYTFCYLIVFLPLMILYVFAVQATPAFFRPSWLMVFAFPLYAGYVLSFQLSQWMIWPDRNAGLKFEDGPNPDFVWKAIGLFGFAIPFALFCFWLGVKYMNNYSLVRETAKEAKSRNSDLT